MQITAVIMAGGQGERFWPASRAKLPKQFLTFDGQQSLLQRTVSRLRGFCPLEQTWVVTRADYAHLVYEQLPQLPRHQVILEPVGRSTAACVALAGLHIRRRFPDAVMLVLPADHLIMQEHPFRAALLAAAAQATRGDYLLTLGIQPTRPETGYGYIRLGAILPLDGPTPIYKVAAFTEKPPQAQAQTYLKSGEYLWNSGIFIWRLQAFEQAVQRDLPALAQALAPIAAAMGTDHEQSVLHAHYPNLPAISLDCGLMEPATNALVIPARFGWDDLGSWAALARTTPADPQGNSIAGPVRAIQTTGCIVQNRAPGRLVVTFGVSDLLVVDTPDLLLVAHKERATEMKELLKQLGPIPIREGADE